MKRNLTAAIILLSLLASCKKETITGNGNTVTEQRAVSDFSKIEVEGKTSVTIAQGPVFAVTARAYSNLLPILETKVTGNILRVGYKNGSNVNNDNSAVMITMPYLYGLSSTGNSEVTITNGTTTNFEASITGASKINAFNFTVQNANLSIEGSGSVEISVTDYLKAKILGSGNVLYKGNPTSVTADITGTGRVEKQ